LISLDRRRITIRDLTALTAAAATIDG